MLEDRAAWEKVEGLEIGGEIDSDHRSLTVRLAGVLRGVKRESGWKEEGDWVMKEDWSMKTKIEFENERVNNWEKRGRRRVGGINKED